jgi:hypothetical protein
MSTMTTHNYPRPTSGDLASATAKIEEVVARNGGVLESYGYGFSCPGKAPDEPINGWQVRLVDTRGMGNHGSFIAVAIREDTYVFQREATLRLLRLWADAAEADGTMSDRGDFATRIVPMLDSELYSTNRGHCIGRDGKWAYFAHSNANFVRIGDGTYRLWVRPVAERVS